MKTTRAVQALAIYLLTHATSAFAQDPPVKSSWSRSESKHEESTVQSCESGAGTDIRYQYQISTDVYDESWTQCAERWREECVQACGKGECAQCRKQCVCPTCSIKHQYPRDEKITKEETEESDWEAQIEGKIMGSYKDAVGSTAIAAEITGKIRSQVKKKKSAKSEESLKDIPLSHGPSKTITDTILHVSSTITEHKADITVSGWYIKWKFTFWNTLWTIATAMYGADYEIINVSWPTFTVTLDKTLNQKTEKGTDPGPVCICPADAPPAEPAKPEPPASSTGSTVAPPVPPENPTQTPGASPVPPVGPGPTGHTNTEGEPPKPGPNPPGFREKVRAGTPDEITPFGATVFVKPLQRFAVPAAVRANDGTLVAVEEVFVQPEGEEPTPLARTGDVFVGKTPVKPTKIFSVVGGVAVAIVGLVPRAGDGDGGGSVPPPAPPEVGLSGTPPSPLRQTDGGQATPLPGGEGSTPPGSPEPPRVSVTEPAPPADFPTKAPVVELTRETPPVTGSEPPEAPGTPGSTGGEPPVPPGTPTDPGVTGTPPSPLRQTDGAQAPPLPGGEGSAPPSDQPPLVRMTDGQPATIAASGEFVPEEIPAMTASIEYPEPKIRSAADVAFASEDTALVRTLGAGDQTGDAIVRIADPEGTVQTGAAQTWTGSLALSQEVVKEGQAVSIRIVTAGLEETRLVKYTLELTSDATPLTPGAMGQIYTGETTVSALQTLVFRASYPTPGAKPVKLFLEPLPSEPRSPGSAWPTGK